MRLARSKVTGILKGYDQLLNLVMDDIEELLRGASNPSLLLANIGSCSHLIAIADPETGVPFVPEQTRSLGLAVLRGTSLVVLSPVDGCVRSASPSSYVTDIVSFRRSESIENPFRQEE